MSLLARSQALTARLAKRFGETATLIRAGALNETTQPPTLGAPTEFTFDVIPTRPGFMDTVSGNTQDGDMPLILATGSTAPTTSDKIRVAGLVYSVHSVHQIKVEGGTAAWKVVARGGQTEGA